MLKLYYQIITLVIVIVDSSCVIIVTGWFCVMIRTFMFSYYEHLMNIFQMLISQNIWKSMIQIFCLTIERFPQILIILVLFVILSVLLHAIYIILLCVTVIICSSYCYYVLEFGTYEYIGIPMVKNSHSGCLPRLHKYT